MLTYKEKVQKELENVLNEMSNIFANAEMALFKLRHAKELVEDIRLEPTKYGIIKPATTDNDLDIIHDEKLVVASKVLENLKYNVHLAYEALDKLLEVSGYERGRICFEQEVKVGRAGYGEYKVKSQEGSTIVEVEKVKLED